MTVQVPALGLAKVPVAAPVVRETWPTSVATTPTRAEPPEFTAAIVFPS